jgi:hypothetical protein
MEKRTSLFLPNLSAMSPAGKFTDVFTRLKNELKAPMVVTTAISSFKNSLTWYGIAGAAVESAKNTRNITHHKIRKTDFEGKMLNAKHLTNTTFL